jgi:hypothetical protein
VLDAGGAGRGPLSRVVDEVARPRLTGLLIQLRGGAGAGPTAAPVPLKGVLSLSALVGLWSLMAPGLGSSWRPSTQPTASVRRGTR